MPTTPSNSVSELLKAAHEYEHNPNLHIALEPFKEVILLLRAKYATYDTITAMLNEKGMKISETTVRKFCRIHQEEMKKLRIETDRKRREANGAASRVTGSPIVSAKPSTGEDKRPPLTSVIGKTEPRVARDNL